MVNSEETTDSLSSCYGFSVQADYPLKFLRVGGGGETLKIVLSSGNHPPQEAAPLLDMRDPLDRLSAQLFMMGRVFHFWTADSGWYRVDTGSQTIEAPTGANEIRREERLWGLPAMLCFIERGDFPLHAAAVEVNAKAVLLAGPSRFGKSTLALEFYRRGYRVLNEDLSCCRLEPEPSVLPGPAWIRIRSEVLEGELPADINVVLSQDDRLHLAMDNDRRGSGQPVPIGAICFLRQSDHRVRLEPLSVPRALPDLWALSFRLPDDDARSRSFRQLGQLGGRIRIYNLYRPLRLDSLVETVDLILRESL